MKKALLLIISTCLSAYCMEPIESYNKGGYSLRRCNKRRREDSNQRQINHKKRRSLMERLKEDEPGDYPRIEEEYWNFSDMGLKELNNFGDCAEEFQSYFALCIRTGLDSENWSPFSTPTSLPLYVKLLDISNNNLTDLPIGLLQKSLPFLEYTDAQHNKLATLDCTDIQPTALTLDVCYNPLSLEEINKALEAGKPTFLQRITPYYRRNSDSGAIARRVGLKAIQTLSYGAYIAGAMNNGIPFHEISHAFPITLVVILQTILGGLFDLKSSDRDAEILKSPINQVRYRKAGELVILHDNNTEDETT